MGKGKREKNFLLLNMSTLPNPLTEVYYDSEGNNKNEKFYFRGVSQMEADTKYFLRKLQKKHAKLDKIFIVASQAARKKSKNWDDASGFLPKKFNDYIKEPKKEISAVEFYELRILQYILGLKNNDDCVGSTNDMDDKVKNELAGSVDDYENRADPLKSDYSEEELDIDKFFQVIPNEEDEKMKNEDEDEDGTYIYEYAKSLCDEILKAKNDSDVNLYVDMQGARRYETFILNAAIKLLEIRGITVTQSVAINYDRDKNKNGSFNEIVDTTINDRIFEMVSGMNEFIKTGRGDTLAEFRIHAQRDENHKYRFKAEKEITDAIIKISDAISLCSVQGFDEGLAAFNIAEEKYSNQTPDSEKFPLFQICLKELEEDYNKYDLLKGKESKVTDQIHWCLDKQLYQQALTLIESKIPASIVDDGILYYGSLEDFRRMMAKFENNGLKSVAKSYIKKNGRISDEVKKYLWIRYVVFEKYPKDSDPFLSMSFWDKDGNGLSIPRIKEIPEEQSDLLKEQSIQIKEFLSFYDGMRELRNKINHATDEAEEKLNDIWEKFCKGEEKRPTMADNLHVLIEKFIKSYKDLGNIHMDLSLQFPIKKYADMFVDEQILFYGNDESLNLLLTKWCETDSINDMKAEYKTVDRSGRETINEDMKKTAFLKNVVRYDSRNEFYYISGWKSVCEERKDVIMDDQYNQKCKKIYELIKMYDENDVPLEELYEENREFQSKFDELKGNGIDLSLIYPLK